MILKRKLLVQLNLNDAKYKFDTEFLNLVCNLIEYLVVGKKDKINKKELCLSIYRDLFGIANDDEMMITKNIEYLWANKNIKKVSYYKLFKTCFTEWTKKK